MFITDETAIPIPSAFLGGDHSNYWAYVKLQIHAPWFFCVYVAQYEDGGEFRHMIFLSRDQQLQEMSRTEGIKIVEVQVVLPFHMTKQDKWIMSPLASIWEGEVPGDLSTESVYITSDGERFCFNKKVTDENQLLDKRLIYKSPVKQAF